MRQIDTLIFDYGGVLVNIDDGQVVRALKNLGISRFKQLWYARTIKRLMHQFIDGLVPEDDTLEEMLKLCRKGTTKDDILEVLDKLCGNLPLDRMQALVKLRKKYKIYLLSNINGFLWRKSVRQIRELGLEPGDCFDDFFLSYEIGIAKPDSRIYDFVKAKTGLIPDRTLYFDDRKDNFEAGRNFGFKSVLVRTDHIEESREWNELLEEIVLKNGTDLHSNTIR